MKLEFTVFVITLGFVSAWPDFYLYNRENPTRPINVNKGLNGVFGYNEAKETKFLIHGFSDSHTGTRPAKVKDALLKNTDANIIAVDWEKGAAMPWYWSAVDNTRVVGKKLAQFIIDNNIDPKTVHCIGHSLGAHTCGFAGKNYKIARITGLDPAGPWFKGNPPQERLDKNDADYVDCIHTDDMLGIQDAICDKDFYPNGGGTQAGCGVSSILNIFNGRRSTESMSLSEARESVLHEDDDNKVVFKIQFYPSSDPRSRWFDIAEVTACSHLRVMHFFAESATGVCPFTSTPCTNYKDWKNGRCYCEKGNTCSSMGLYADRNTDPGKFYLNTNKYSLYCQN